MNQVVSVRAMCSMLVLGFSINKCVHSSGIGACFFSNLFCLQLCVLVTLSQYGRRIPLVYGFWSWGFVGLGGL